MGDIVNSGIGLSYRPTIAYVACQADTQPYAGVDFIPPVKDYEFGHNWHFQQNRHNIVLKEGMVRWDLQSSF